MLKYDMVTRQIIRAAKRAKQFGRYQQSCSPKTFPSSPTAAGPDRSGAAMENRIERHGFRSVPQFGGWESQNPEASGYTIMFSRARADREQLKRDIKRSLGNEQELLASMPPVPLHPRPERDSFLRSLSLKRIIAYICCMKS